ncbi:unnamed protein product [Boreogadus saida]
MSLMGCQNYRSEFPHTLFLTAHLLLSGSPVWLRITKQTASVLGMLCRKVKIGGEMTRGDHRIGWFTKALNDRCLMGGEMTIWETTTTGEMHAWNQNVNT